MTDLERFISRCRLVPGGHTIWTGGCQFRFHDGWRCSPTQAAYLLCGGHRLRPGEAVWRTCKVAGCVAHVRHGPTGKAREILTTAQVVWLRSLPRLRLGMVAELAAKMGVSPSRINVLRSRHSWSTERPEARP